MFLLVLLYDGMLFVNSLWIFWQPTSTWSIRSFLELGEFNQRLGVFYLCRFQNWHMSIYFEIDIPPNLSQPGRRQQSNLFSILPIRGCEIGISIWEINICQVLSEKSTYVDLLKWMPITSAPIGQNRHMLISHHRDKLFIMAVIARYRVYSFQLCCKTSSTLKRGICMQKILQQLWMALYT